VALLLLNPKDTMTLHQKTVLYELSRHFMLSDDEESGEEVDTESDTTKKRKKRKRSSPRNPWQRVLKLKSLLLPPPIKQHLRDHGTDPKLFLNDDGLLRNSITDFSAETVGDAFIACYQYTLHLVRRRTHDSSRWYFTMLLYYDLVKLIRPKGSGRVGHLMRQELVKFLGSVLGPKTIQLDVALTQLNEWSRLGMKLDILCAEFGDGCLFYLDELLSADL
jgi:hypothetical protein